MPFTTYLIPIDNNKRININSDFENFKPFFFNSF
jgi:hypothetical protein